MEKDKASGVVPEPPVFVDLAWEEKERQLQANGERSVDDAEGQHVPAHHGFRDKYFTSFKKDNTQS